MKKIQDPAQAFLMKIQALYDIEKQLEKALPKMAKAAKDEGFQDAFLSHLEETKEHSKRLEGIFKMLGVAPKKLSCDGIRGIVEDTKWTIEQDATPALKDAMIASAARYAEHYEMAGYMSAIAQARFLGMVDAAALLTETLAEEQAADKVLDGAMKAALKEA
ncbi:MAG TPA: DUF892 family protein [Candidatus Paceibacterota bacterium]